jgi:hypothetical protein
MFCFFLYIYSKDQTGRRWVRPGMTVVGLASSGIEQVILRINEYCDNNEFCDNNNLLH